MILSKHFFVFSLSILGIVLLSFSQSEWYHFALIILFYIIITSAGVYWLKLNYFVESHCNFSEHSKKIALSFDDGPDEKSTAILLDILKQKNVKATFFLIGKKIQEQPEIAKRIFEEGHQIGNHSFSHSFWYSMQLPSSILQDIKHCNNEIKEITGKENNLFRPPYGITNPMVAAGINRSGMKSIGWSLRSFDTMSKSANELLTKLKEVKGGDVILLHDHVSFTAEMLSDFIDFAQRKGFVFSKIEV